MERRRASAIAGKAGGDYGSVNKRREVDIQIGTLLNELEPFEFDLDDLLAKTMTGDVSVPRVLYGLTWARHHAYQARLRTARVFDRIQKEGSVFIDNVRSLDNALGEMKETRRHIRKLLVHLIECEKPISNIVKEHDQQGKYLDLWTRILRRSLSAPKVIDVAIASLIAARVTAT